MVPYTSLNSKQPVLLCLQLDNSGMGCNQSSTSMMTFIGVHVGTGCVLNILIAVISDTCHLISTSAWRPFHLTSALQVCLECLYLATVYTADSRFMMQPALALCCCQLGTFA